MSITLQGSSDSTFSDGININSGKFTVAAASGNTVVGGTLAVTGKITTTTAGIDVPTSALGNVHSGTYTPTITATTNITGTPTGQKATYLRVGNSVTVAGGYDFTATSTGNTVMKISLPIASNLATGYELSGVGVNGYYNAASIGGDATNDVAQVVMSVTSSGAQGFRYQFTYEVI